MEADEPRESQPATHLGDGVTRPWIDEDDVHYDDSSDDGYNNGEDWSDPSALSRGWAFFRLVGLVIFCGLAGGATVGIGLWIALTALDSSL